MIETINLTIMGANHYQGFKAFTVKDKVRLIKEPNNIHDEFAIRVENKEEYTLGYITNNGSYLKGGSCTNEDAYNYFGSQAMAEIIEVDSSYVVCELLYAECTNFITNKGELLIQLRDLLQDRESFITNDYDSNLIYLKDIEALKKAIGIIEEFGGNYKYD